MKTISKLRSEVESIMINNQRQPFFSLATVLLSMSLPYESATRLRSIAYSKGWLNRRRLSCPVISIGNLTTGGTGKTPMTLHCARLAVDLGLKPVIVSRGYKGSYRAEAMTVSDGKTLLANATQAGDEPYLMAAILKKVPVVVGRDRYTVGKMAIARFQPDILLLDDGFQHMQLHRDLNILLLDAMRPFGNGYLLPRGMLRESRGALARADAIILTRSESPLHHHGKFAEMIHPRPIFSAKHSPVLRGILPANTACDTRIIEDRPAVIQIPSQTEFFAFSGLARNDLFFSSLEKNGYVVKGTIGFDDHHPYVEMDIRRILDQAERVGVRCLITTDKDYVRLPESTTLPLPLMVLGSEMKMIGEGWSEYFADRLKILIGLHRKKNIASGSPVS